MPSRRSSARPDRSRLARHRPGQSLPAAGSAFGLRAVRLRRRGTLVRLGVARNCSSGPAWSTSRPASPSSSAAGACCPICVQPRSCTPGRRGRHQPAHVLERRRRQRSRHPVRASRWAPWRCWPTAATPSCWRRWRRSRCWSSRSAPMSRARAVPSDYTTAGILGGIVFLVALLAWPVATPAAGHGSDRAAPAGGPRQPRAAVAVHRAAPAREHRGRGPREPHPPHQRIRGRAARRQQRLSGRAARRGVAAASLSTGDLARSAPRRPARPRTLSSPPMAAT